MFKAVCFHGIITEQLLSNCGVRKPGQGWYHHWLWISTNVWMKVGTPCTYVCQPDIDYTASVSCGEIKYSLRLTAIPGHLSNVMPTEEAIKFICESHFREADKQINWLRNLTQSGRVESFPPTSFEVENAQICVCPINDLMIKGCTCGAIIN